MQPDPVIEHEEEPTSYAEAREKLIDIIRWELVGPDNNTDNEALIYETLNIEAPLQRYKIGVLYPKPRDASEFEQLEKDTASNTELPQDTEETSKVLGKKAEESIVKMSRRKIYEEQPEENHLSDLAFSGIQRPASMAISFFIPETADKKVKARFVFTGGVYIEEESRTWVRKPIKLEAEKILEDLFSRHGAVKIDVSGEALNASINLRAFVRPHKGKGILVTLSAINETASSDQQGEKLSNDERAVFQAKLSVEMLDGLGKQTPAISAYPKSESRQDDIEEQSLDLLYRHFETYAIGHGCSAGWPEEAKDGFVPRVWSTAFPEYEIYSITPELKRENGDPISVSMADLAGLDDEARGFDAIDELLERYGAWIEQKRKEASKLPAQYHEAAKKNLDLCKECLVRMQQGLNFLKENENAWTAFQLANKAILIQQKRFSDDRRDIQIDESTKRLFFKGGKFKSTEAVLSEQMETKGKWRPFQIAFLLLSLKSAALNEAPDREIVDLIWFPTGGGKTEAYFGLAAFSILYRRLEDPEDSGVSVLMRYTLRLLTADQFERAAGLICALEYIRRENQEDIGNIPFSIGIWMGMSTTPNSRTEAKSNLRELRKNASKTANKFLVTKCPWCAAQIGPARVEKNTKCTAICRKETG
jgi:hypothetical protein